MNKPNAKPLDANGLTPYEAQICVMIMAAFDHIKNRYLQSGPVKLQQGVELDYRIVTQIAVRCTREIDKIEHIHKIDPDHYKQASFISYWICKLKPVYISDQKVYTLNTEMAKIINEYLAIQVAMFIINSVRADNHIASRITYVKIRPMIKELFYTLVHCDVSASALAIIFQFIGTYVA